jgi:hypothetical protein
VQRRVQNLEVWHRVERIFTKDGELLTAMRQRHDRLRLFDVLGLLGDRPVIAWSAGAMALAERIVLFHDDPPQGSSHAEVMEAGLGLVPGVVALPHAAKRLDVGDPLRVQLMSRRFAPAICVLLDVGSRIDWRDSRWRGELGTRRLTEDGTVADVGVEEVGQ